MFLKVLRTVDTQDKTVKTVTIVVDVLLDSVLDTTEKRHYEQVRSNTHDTSLQRSISAVSCNIKCSRPYSSVNSVHVYEAFCMVESLI